MKKLILSVALIFTLSMFVNNISAQSTICGCEDTDCYYDWSVNDCNPFYYEVLCAVVCPEEPDDGQ